MEDPTVSIPGSHSSEKDFPARESPGMWGPFRLLQRVGVGAFGEVYRAWDPALEREVALKLLLPGVVDDDADYKAVLKEARLMARVKHPNVVSVHGVDRHEGRVGFWSDFVQGRTLSALLEVQGPFSAREAAHVGIELCRALSAVHAAGLLHRDVKAGNVMREAGGRILLMDFGLTNEGEGRNLSGTLQYMAPELLTGGTASVGSDLYALGVLLFHLTTTKYPVEASTLGDYHQAHKNRSRRNLMDERPDLPEQFVRVIETALEPQPAKRYASAGQMLTALSEGLGMGSISRDPLTVVPSKPRRFRTWMLAPLVLAAAAGTAYFAPGVKNRLPGAVSQSHRDYERARNLLDHYYQPHSLDRSIPLFEKTIAEDPKFAMAQAGLGRAYWRKYLDTQDAGFIQKSKDACDRALALDDNLAWVHVTLGMLYTETGRNDLAAQELDRALQLDSTNAEAFAAQAELFRKQGRNSEVEPAYQKAMDLDPGDWRWPNQLGNFYLLTGKFDLAAQLYKRTIQLVPDNPRVYGNLGLAYLNSEHFNEAEIAYDKAVEIEPNYGNLSRLGVLLLLEGKFSDAASMLKRALDSDPTQYTGWANLAAAVQWIQDGGKSKSRELYLKAIALGEAVRRQSPKDPRILANLGSYYAEVGVPEKSLPLLRQAVALDQGPQTYYRVAEGYELLHRRNDALAWIGKALQGGYSMEFVKRNPELADLRADPGFAPYAHQSK
jgi:serine/threonine protein kinase/Tfp pilus assembly protein PilF